MPSSRLLSDLRQIVGPANVLCDDDVTERYRIDWTGRFVAPSAVVVRPGSTDEVAAVVQACAVAGVPVVAQGGNTGLVGGGVPMSGEIVVNVSRLDSIEVDPTSGHVVAGAGATLAAVQQAALDGGWEYAIDIASRESATIGGTVATNAGGLRTVRHGDTRRQLAGIEFVTGTGRIVSALREPRRDNTGYHLPSLLAGSEGTLGVITRARLALVPTLSMRCTALLRFGATADAASAAEELRRALPFVEAIEFFLPAGLDLVCRVFGLAHPFAEHGGAYLLVETAGPADPTTELGEAVASLPGVADVAIAEDSQSRSRLWKLRELHTEAISTVGIPHKLDVAVPPGRLAEFIDAVPAVVAGVAPDAEVWMFGHAGESSVHVNVTGPPADDDTVDDAVLRLVIDLGGSISAEHGIGRAKLPWLATADRVDELGLLADIKDAFDPHHILNPSVLVAVDRAGETGRASARPPLVFPDHE